MIPRWPLLFLGLSNPALSGEAGIRVDLQAARERVASSDDLVLTARFSNPGDSPLRLATLFLDIPAVVLEVRDRRGERVPLGPPPVPPIDDGETARKLLHPGETLSVRFQGSAIFGEPLPPGAYTVRYRFEARNDKAGQGDWEGLLRSPELRFEVTGDGSDG